MPVSEMQVRWWAEVFTGNKELPSEMAMKKHVNRYEQKKNY